MAPTTGLSPVDERAELVVGRKALRPQSAPGRSRRAASSVCFQEDDRAFAMRHSESALSLDEDELGEIPPPASPIRQRARSTGSLTDASESARRHPHRIRICYQDDAYRLRSEARTRSLMAAATASSSATDASSNSALLAKKALKYRKVYDRMTGVNVHDPEFDVFKFLGVDWCKTASLKDRALPQV